MPSLNNWIAYIVIGRVLVYLFQQFPLPKFLTKYPSVEKLHNCDLCAGVWIFGILSIFTKTSLMESLQFGYVPGLSELVTGGVISFMVHIFIIGWKIKFSEIMVV